MSKDDRKLSDRQSEETPDSGVNPDAVPVETEDCSEESAHAARFLRAVKTLATTPKSALGKPEQRRKSRAGR